MKNKILNVVEKHRIYNDLKHFCETCNYSYTEYGLNKVIEHFEENKGWIIEKFIKSKNFNREKLRIEIEYNELRGFNPSEISNYYYIFISQIGKENEINEGIRQVLRSLMYKGYDEEKDVRYEPKEFVSEKWIKKYCDENGYIKAIPKIKARKDVRTSKLIGKIVKETKLIDKFSFLLVKDNREKQVNGEWWLSEVSANFKLHNEKKKMYISINPIDYLLMSIGNSWSSCYYTGNGILEVNSSNTYEGMHKNGTVGYMLDETTAIVYTESSKKTKGYITREARQCLYLTKRGDYIQSKIYGNATTKMEQWGISIDKEFSKIFNKNYHIFHNDDLYNDEIRRVQEMIRYDFNVGYNDIYNGVDFDIHLTSKKEEQIEELDFGSISSYSIFFDTGTKNTETETSLDNTRKVWCNYREEYGNWDTLYVENYGEVNEDDLYNSGDFIYCANCRNWYYKNDVDYIILDGENYCCEDCVEDAGYKYCDETGGWEDEDNVVYSEEQGISIYYPDAIYIDNLDSYVTEEWCKRNDYIQNKYEEWVKIDKDDEDQKNDLISNKLNYIFNNYYNYHKFHGRKDQEIRTKDSCYKLLFVSYGKSIMAIYKDSKHIYISRNINDSVTTKRNANQFLQETLNTTLKYKDLKQGENVINNEKYYVVMA